MLEKKYRTREEKQKRNMCIGIFLSLLLILFTILIYQFIVIPEIKEATEKNTMTRLYGKGENIYVLKMDLKRGERVDSNCLKKEYTNELTVPKDSLKSLSEIQDKVARISLSKNTPVNSNMLVNMDEYVTQDLRDVDYSDVLLNKDLRKGQFVDIIYRKKDGTDFTVVSKVKVNNVAAQTLYTSMTAQQRQYKDNATVKASLTGGTMLTVRYTDAENQKPARVTYALDKNVEKIINADPAAVKKAGEVLEKKNIKSNETKSKPDFADEDKK